VAIKCPKCRFDNTDAARFCSNCATTLGAPRDRGPSLTKTLQSSTYVVAPGTVIAGHYEVLEKLGQGGMGEVYRALDKNLGRQVAIKILPEEFSADPERLARFEREAKLLAALNHPNIAAVYGFEEANGLRFLVLELVEGETLQARLFRGGLPLDEALETCRQVADGLEAAHDRGVVHRDLKPGNIMITAEGKVKVLDFGLAKAFLSVLPIGGISDSPTITEEMTQAGVLLGTAAYMSPEQAKGKPVDKRADIWAFGCILFECLTGRMAFPGDTISEVLAAVLRGEPEWEALPKNLAPDVRVALIRCLRKDRNLRYHDIADVRLEMMESISPTLGFESVQSGKMRLVWKALAVFFGIGFLGLASVLVGILLKKPSAPPLVKTTVELPAGMQMTKDTIGPTRTELAVSPDGRYVAYSASADGLPTNAMLFLRAMDSPESKPVAGTEGARCPFFSPDGKWIGFWAQGKIHKASLSGGLPIPLGDLGDMPIGASWGSKGQIIIGRIDKGLWIFDSEGGKPEALTFLDPARETTHRFPYFLPGDNAILLSVMPHALGDRAWIEALSLPSGRRKVLVEGGLDGRYVPTGHIVFMRRGTLLAVPFDPNRLETTGAAVPVIEGVMHAQGTGTSSWNSGSGQFSFSNSGSLAYASGAFFPEHENQLIWIDRRGSIEPIAALGKKSFINPRISPDGQKMVFRTYGMNGDVWLYDLLRGTSSRLTNEGYAESVIWTPDGKFLTFGYSKAGALNLFSLPWDSRAAMEALTTLPTMCSPGSWSPDGRFLAFVEGRYTSEFDIYIYRKEDRKVEPFLCTEYSEAYPEFSPDGRWLAYVSNESGREEVYVTEFPGPGKKIAISNAGGSAPVWAHDGLELFYWKSGYVYSNLSNDKLMVADVVTRPVFRAQTPRVLCDVRTKIMFSGPIRSYDISTDGRRFLAVAYTEIKPSEVTRFNLIQNWFEELKRLVPTGKK
jgi:serine/threonine protein kinase/Tol biopolymer transport system component